MPHTRYSSDEIVEGGQALYDREIRDELDASARGKFLVLDIDEIDADERAALKRARRRHPAAASSPCTSSASGGLPPTAWTTLFVCRLSSPAPGP